MPISARAVWKVYWRRARRGERARPNPMSQAATMLLIRRGFTDIMTLPVRDRALVRRLIRRGQGDD